MRGKKSNKILEKRCDFLKSQKTAKSICLISLFLSNVYAETWSGTFGTTNKDLNAGVSEEITMGKQDGVRGNNFGYQDKRTFTYKTKGDKASSLILKADSTLSDLQFYLEGGMNIKSLSNLTIDYGSIGGRNGVNNGFNHSGSLSIDSNASFSVKNVGAYVMRGSINNSGTLNLQASKSIKNVGKIINDGGDIAFNGEYWANEAYVSSFYTSLSEAYGELVINGGKVVFEKNLYNTGVQKLNTSGIARSKVILNDGEIEVKGAWENGGYTASGKSGAGELIGRSGKITIHGKFTNKVDSGYNSSYVVRSLVDLEDTIFVAQNIYNESNSDILLSGSAKMTTSGTFESKKDSSITFIGTQNGFGSIEAGTLKLDGEENYQIRVLKKTNDYKYFIASGTSVTGLTEGEIEIKDANGNKSDLYKAKLVKETNNTKESWYIKLTKLPATPNAPSKPDQTPSDDDIFGDIIFVTQDSLNKANDALNNQASILNTIPQNIDIFMGWTTMLDRSTVMLSKALSSNTKPISIALLKKAQKLANKGQINPQEYRSDAYTNSIIQLESPYKKASFYANIMGGINGYKNSLGYGYGVNLGFDGYGSDDFFGGVFLSLERYDIKAQDLRLDSIHYRLGSYMRARASKVEFDGLLEYIYAPSEYKRVLPINGISTYSDASYHTQALDAQLRIGPRFGGDSSFKPYMGVLLEYYHTPSFKESGGLNLDVSKNAFLHLSGILGFEYRKLFDASSLYLALEAVSGAIIAGDKYLSLTRNNTTIDFKNANIIILMGILS